MVSRIEASNSYRLATNHLMPKVGLGTWKMTPKQIPNIVYAAIQHGYSLIDCASGYKNEKDIGKVLTKAINSEKIISRDEIFITSKLANTDHASNDVKNALQRTLRDLNLEYLDLYLMHFPVSWPNRRTNDDDYPEGFHKDFYGTQTNTTIFETWHAMEQLVDDGLVKDIGVSNFSCPLIWELDKKATKPISVNQIELHPFCAQNALVELCHCKNIQITAYSSLGPISYKDKLMYKSFLNLLETEEIQEIAQKYNKSAAQILLAWAVNAQNVAVIPKTSDIERLKQNMDVLNIELDESDVYMINEFDRGIRFNDKTVEWGISVFSESPLL